MFKNQTITKFLDILRKNNPTVSKKENNLIIDGKSFRTSIVNNYTKSSKDLRVK